MNPVRLCVVVLIDHEIFSLIGCINDGLAISYHSPELSLSRHSSAVPWGFTLSGGQDQALTIKVGCVLQVRLLTHFTLHTSHFTHNISFKCNLNCQESVAETCGLRTRDFIWKVNDVEVFNKSHADCVKMIKAGGEQSLTLTVS